MGKFFSLLFLLTVLLFLLVPQKVLAAEVIKQFNVQILAHKDGNFEVTEEIIYDFGTGERHGIYRDIPLVSKVGDLYRVIKIDFLNILRDGNVENYSVQSTSSKASVKIGNAGATITGLHTYTISYVVVNGIGSNFNDHDEIYWNVTGNEWQIPVLASSVKIATDFAVVPNRAICFVGAQGSVLKDCNFSKVSSIFNKRPLAPYEGFTAVWSFPKGTFPPSILQIVPPQSRTSSNIETDSGATKIILFIILSVPIFLNLILTPWILIWYFRNKRKERFGAPTVSFDIPKDSSGKRISPAEAGSIDVYQVDQNDVIATIFDLAIRKYLKIEQSKKEKVLGIFGGGEDYTFVKLKDLEKVAPVFEQVIWNKLFENVDSISLDSLRPDFYETFQKFEPEVFNSLINRSFYNKNPKNRRALLLIAGIFVIFAGGLLLGPLLIYLSRKLNGRTALGDEVDFKIDGLKIFLKNMTRYYTWQAKNLYTVEEYIPYAVALGFIKEFMDQLKVIYPNYQPSWYFGNTAFYLASSNLYGSMSSSFTTHAPSSSSGFSGGFSGGGGGGGGGGSW